jgi:predicted DNA-binding transcriptional regulator YafY
MRNAEVIRQWSILRDLESSRRLTIDEMAERTGVTTRTIRRDLEALQAAGFPLYDEAYDGRKYWMLEQRPFRRLDETGFTLAELSALYFSRTLVECLSATPFQKDVRSAFDKLGAALTPGMRQFLDRLPLVMAVKADPGAQPAAGRAREVAQLLDATLHNRRVTLRYHSASSNREKDYLVEPHRVVFAQGALYLIAHVPEYQQTRTFAVERLVRVSLTDERFDPPELGAEAFEHSLGVHQGPPERIEVAFDREIAHYVKARLWHQSQEIAEQADGSVAVTLHVSNDRALRNWILGFGALARVVSPPSLAGEIADELTRARARYEAGARS